MHPRFLLIYISLLTACIASEPKDYLPTGTIPHSQNEAAQWKFKGDITIPAVVGAPFYTPYSSYGFTMVSKDPNNPVKNIKLGFAGRPSLTIKGKNILNFNKEVENCDFGGGGYTGILNGAICLNVVNGDISKFLSVFYNKKLISDYIVDTIAAEFLKVSYVLDDFRKVSTNK